MSDASQNTFVRTLVFAGLALVLAVVALVWWVDPFQVLHKPYAAKQLLNENQRYQDGGLINSYLRGGTRAYDSAAFGTSASVNFTEESMARHLGWKHTLRLFLPGGSPAEIAQVVRTAVRSGKLKHVLLEMDLWSMNGEYRPADNSTFPLYLYDNQRANDFRYFVDPLVVIESVKTLFGIADTRNGTVEKLGYWGDGDWVPKQRAGLNAPEHVHALANERLNLAPWSEAQIVAQQYPALEKEILPLLKELCNQDVEVVLFVPPYSMLYFHEKQQDVMTVIYEPRYILKGIAGCRNIRLHAFDLENFTLDLNNYKDHRHYMPQVSEQLLAWMGVHQHELHLDSIATYEQAWINKLNQRTLYSTYPAEPQVQ